MAEIISERINQTKRVLEIEISRTAEVKKPEFKDSFYLIYSPRTVRIRPCDSTKLNLGIKINLPDRIEAGFGILPSIVSSSLTIENFKRITNKTKDKFVKLDLLNRNFHNTIKIKKDQAFAYSGTFLKRTSFKADTSLRRTKKFVQDDFLRNPL